MTRPVHALVLGVALSLFATSGFAATVEQKGQPEQNIPAMQSYGVNVPTEKGLRTVVPAGWRTYVHESITLPETMTWKPGQSWTSVVGDLAEKAHAVVLIDWQEKAVYLRTVEVALEQDAKQAQVLQAATTPLPRFDVQQSKTAVGSKTDAPAVDAARPQLAAASIEATPAPSSKQSTVVASSDKSVPAVAPALPPAVAPEGAASDENKRADKAVPVVDVAKTLAPTEQLLVTDSVKGASTAKLSAQASVSSVAASTDAAGASQMAAALTAAVPALAPTQIPAPAVAAAATQAALPALAPTVPPAASTALSDSPDFSYQAPVALNKPQARTVAQGIADHFHLRLVWLAPDIQLRGPVTLLGNSAEGDVTLLQKALGVFAPVSFEIPTGQGVLAVRSFYGNYPDLAAQASKQPVVAVSQPVNQPTASVAQQPVSVVVASAPVAPVVQVAAPVVAAAVPEKLVPAETAKAPELSVAQVVVSDVASAPVVASAPAVAAPPARALLTADTSVPELELTVHVGEPLEVAIARFAESQLYTVDWQVQGGFKAKRELSYHGKTIAEVLSQFLPALGVSADINKQEKHIVVRPADPVRDL
ncbi:hypothetical protein [Burkholderia cenocepacia]|uniref:hypothetical protein n=1 Tax=Burkholderia cenocepacia TaxID=95486 RepID=UPI000761C2AE|nr:hypothetical protein [Burkholderia cenocepacia]KWU17828.1 hypothetical protein AS149_13995 [Burkholderia cenocepacia]